MLNRPQTKREGLRCNVKVGRVLAMLWNGGYKWLQIMDATA